MKVLSISYFCSALLSLHLIHFQPNKLIMRVLNILTGLKSKNTSLSKNNSFFWNLTDFLYLFVVVASLGRFCVLDFVSFCDVFVS